MYDDDYADDWRPAFRLPCIHGIPWNLLSYAAAFVGGIMLGRRLRKMQRQIDTLEAMLLPPKR